MTVTELADRRTVAVEFRILLRKLDVVDRKITAVIDCGGCVREWTHRRRLLERQLVELVRSDSFRALVERK